MSVTGKEKKTCTAILLAGGQGKRMGTDTQKQYLLIRGYPVLYYSLRTFQQSEIIDDVILVTGSGQTDYVRREFVERYGFSKVSRIVEGGRERYDSVWEGLKAAQDAGIADDSYIFIHDSARPFLTEEILERAYEDVERNRACVVGVRDYVRKCGLNGVVIGLSGGMDSALVACIAVEALGPEHVLGVLMPSRWSSDHSETDAEVLARKGGQSRLYPCTGHRTCRWYNRQISLGGKAARIEGARKDYGHTSPQGHQRRYPKRKLQVAIYRGPGPGDLRSVRVPGDPHPGVRAHRALSARRGRHHRYRQQGDVHL